MSSLHRRILLLVVVFAVAIATLTVAQEPPDRPEPERGWPKVCSNPELLKAVRIIERACTPAGCDFRAMQELDTRVDKALFLGTLRDPNLYPVHIFFPTNQTKVSGAFDWATVKRDQLAVLRYIEDPTNAVIIVLGHASTSGSRDQNIRLARDRMASVMAYMRDTLRVKCRSLYGAWLPEDTFRLTEEDARLLNISERDYRGDAFVLNQSVHVFVYPCADLL